MELNFVIQYLKQRYCIYKSSIKPKQESESLEDVHLYAKHNTTRIKLQNRQNTISIEPRVERQTTTPSNLADKIKEVNKVNEQNK